MLGFDIDIFIVVVIYVSLSAFVSRLALAWSPMSPMPIEEVYDSESTKTKAIFVFGQCAYCVVCLLPVPIFFYFRSGIDQFIDNLPCIETNQNIVQVDQSILSPFYALINGTIISLVTLARMHSRKPRMLPFIKSRLRLRLAEVGLYRSRVFARPLPSRYCSRNSELLPAT